VTADLGNGCNTAATASRLNFCHVCFQPEPDFKGKNTNDSHYQKPTAKSWAMPRVVVKNKTLKNQ
jgi:hypothetical protein